MLPFPYRLPFAVLVVLLIGAGASACASSGGSSDRMPGTAPMISVERFLQAANTDDFDAMARIFGTSRGPIADQTGNPLSCAFRRMGSWIRIGNRCALREHIELRMNAIALILSHDSYRVRSETGVPGRSQPTRRVGVDIERGRESFPDVPFLVVQTSDGQWLVEEIGLERLTSE